MITLKEFIVENLDQEVNGRRGNIRELKKVIEIMRSNVKKTSEEKIRSMLADSPELLEEYDSFYKQMEERANEGIKKLIETGKIKEVYYDKDGNKIELEG
jgi:translation initiation factor 2 alpha subunit (eIF-2alpha)